MKIRAWAALEPGKPLTEWTYDCPPLAPNEVLLKVQACGLCHSDIHMIDNDWGQSRYPLVPGHEVVGTITNVGSAVTQLTIGHRVGVGWQRSACLVCDDCLRGNENCCDKSESLIGDGYGGFAEYVIVDSRFCFLLPDQLPTEYAGPLMCGGITVYGGLRAAGLSSGQRVGVIGLGGLGHLAVQFASRLGNHVTVFTTTESKAEEAIGLGAKETIMIRNGKPSRTPSRPFHLILSTVPVAIPLEPYLNMLCTDGALCMVGVPNEPLSLHIFPLLVKRRRLLGSPIGSRAQMREMLELAARLEIKPIIEKFPMAEVNSAIEKVRNNTIRYRAVLVP